MKVLGSIAAGALLLIGPLALEPRPAIAQQDTLVPVDMLLLEHGQRARKVLGREVTNEHDEKVGKIDDLIVGPDEQLFAVLQVGGFLGLGSRLIAVPYDSLVFSDDGKDIDLPGATQEGLKALAEFNYHD